MKFCPIIHNALEAEDFKGIVMVLAHEALARSSMLQALEENRHEHYLIIDNGVAEGKSVPFSMIVDLMHQLDAQEIVMPDVLRDFGATMTLFEKYQSMVPVNKRTLVLQAHDLDEAKENWRILRDGPHWRKFHTIAIPKHLGRDARRGLLRFMNGRWPPDGHPVHLLGATGNILDEIDAYTATGIPRSMDSSAPQAFAQVREDVGYHLIEPSFAEVAEYEHGKALRNLRRIRKACRAYS